MDPKIQFQKSAAVLTADGQQVGHLTRVVLNPDTQTLTDILVRVGGLFNHEEKVVPIEFIAETTDTRIVLHEDAGSLDTFPPFEEKYLVDAYNYADQPPHEENGLPIIFGHVDVGMRTISPASERQLVSQVTQNISPGAVAMKKRARVVTADGKYAGNVERILADPSDDHLTHLLVSNGLFKKTVKLIPVQWVTMLGVDDVHLRVEKSELDELPEAPTIT